MSATPPAILTGPSAFSPPIPLTGPTLALDDALYAEIAAVMESGLLTNAVNVSAFERLAAEFLEVEHVVAVASCTAGLMLVFCCLGLEGEVVLPSFTFMASGHAVEWNALRPIFADADPTTFNLDLADAAAAITPATAAVSVTHVFGAPADVNGLEQASREAAGRELPIIVDAAHGFGARYQDGTRVGTKGTAEVFSLSPTKPLSTGEGGLVATRDATLAHDLRQARDYGNAGDYDCAVVGLNARMTEIAGVLGRRNLAVLPQWLERRAELAARYVERLRELPGLGFQEIPSGARSSHKDFSVTVDEGMFGLGRAVLAAALAREGIPTRNYFNPPLHRLTVYQAYAEGIALPKTDALADQMLTLPLSSHMPFEHVERICDALGSLYEHRTAVSLVEPDDAAR